MFKELLFKIFVSDRLKIDPSCMTVTTLALYLVAILLVMYYGSLVTAILLCFLRIVAWACIAWLWADILWLNRYAWLRDRSKDLWPR